MYLSREQIVTQLQEIVDRLDRVILSYKQGDALEYQRLEKIQMLRDHINNYKGLIEIERFDPTNFLALKAVSHQVNLFKEECEAVKIFMEMKVKDPEAAHSPSSLSSLSNSSNPITVTPHNNNFSSGVLIIQRSRENAERREWKGNAINELNKAADSLESLAENMMTMSKEVQASQRSTAKI